MGAGQSRWTNGGFVPSAYPIPFSSLAWTADPASASELATQLGKGADSLISYVISFYVIAQFWLVHHRVFRRITGQSARRRHLRG